MPKIKLPQKHRGILKNHNITERADNLADISSVLDSDNKFPLMANQTQRQN